MSRLDTVAGWRREIGRVYREMRRGLMPADVGTRLTYVARIGAQLTQMEEELKEMRGVRQQLERIEHPQLTSSDTP